jgi:hypothetical protein
MLMRYSGHKIQTLKIIKNEKQVDSHRDYR